MGRSGDGKRNILWGWPYHKTSKEASTMLSSVVKHLGSGRLSTQEVGTKTRLRPVFSPTLLSCSTATCVLYNRTDHSRGFFICLN